MANQAYFSSFSTLTLSLLMGSCSSQHTEVNRETAAIRPAVVQPTAVRKTVFDVKPFRMHFFSKISDAGSLVKPLDPKKAQEMVDLFHSVEDWAHPPEIIIPDRLELQAMEQFGNAFYDNVNRALTIPFQFRFSHMTQHPSKTRPAWTHEFGHVLFSENLMSIAPRLATRYAELVKLDRAYQEKSVLLRSSMKAQGRPKAEIFKAQKALDDSLFWFPEYEAIGTMLGPFDEFAADIVSAMHHNVPDGMRDSLFFAFETAENNRDADLRSFKRFRANDARRGTEMHVYFSFARVQLWRFCMNPTRRFEIERHITKGQILKNIFLGLGSVLEKRFLANQLVIEETEAEHMRLNQEVWLAIDAAMVDPNTGKDLCSN